MGASTAFKPVDVAAMLLLLNAAHATRDGNDGRWRIILGGVCRLAGGCAATLSVAEPGNRPSHYFGVEGPVAAALVSIAEGDDDDERSDPALRRLLRRVTSRGDGETLTLPRRGLVPDDAWYASPHVREVRQSAGLDDCIYSAHVGPAGAVACLTVSRAWGERAFRERERHAVHLMHHACAWAHRNGHEAPTAALEAIPLSPRQKQTLWSLLAGHGEKQIAAEMRLSVNTVHHYVKALYKLFGVSSRGELLAKWMHRDA